MPRREEPVQARRHLVVTLFPSWLITGLCIALVLILIFVFFVLVILLTVPLAEESAARAAEGVLGNASQGLGHRLAPDRRRDVRAVHLRVAALAEADAAQRMLVAAARVAAPDRARHVRRVPGEPGRGEVVDRAGLVCCWVVVFVVFGGVFGLLVVVFVVV